MLLVRVIAYLYNERTSELRTSRDGVLDERSKAQRQTARSSSLFAASTNGFIVAEGAVVKRLLRILLMRYRRTIWAITLIVLGLVLVVPLTSAVIIFGWAVGPTPLLFGVGFLLALCLFAMLCAIKRPR